MDLLKPMEVFLFRFLVLGGFFKYSSILNGKATLCLEEVSVLQGLLTVRMASLGLQVEA